MTTHTASDQLDFTKAMKLLRRYSMIEETNILGIYSIHPVVHKWAFHYFQDEICKTTGLTAIKLVRNTLIDLYLSTTSILYLSTTSILYLTRTSTLFYLSIT